jgi:hypothetical protein
LFVAPAIKVEAVSPQEDGHDEDKLGSSTRALFGDSDKEMDDPEDSVYDFGSIFVGFQS